MHQSKMIVGAGGAKTRDDALELGEAQPDYMFFGRFGYDNKPEPHPRNLARRMVGRDDPGALHRALGGSTIASVRAVAATGVDFVALSAAVFADGADPAAGRRRANAAARKPTPRVSRTDDSMHLGAAVILSAWPALACAPARRPRRGCRSARPRRRSV
jgi:thiamine-phosphate pyrophosphorylase